MIVFFSRILAFILILFIPYSLIYLGDIEATIFFHINSLLLVLFGTYAASLLSYDFIKVNGALLATFRALFKELNNKLKKREIQYIIDISKRVKETNGLGCIDDFLEDKTKKISPFLRYGLELLISNYSEAKLKEMLSNFANELNFQQKVQEGIVLNMAIFSPAFGMIGTVMGLIIMLTNLDVDTGAIGKGLAFALITTLYGVVLSNIIFRPANIYLLEQRKFEQNYIEALTIGILQLRQRTDSILIQDYLNSYLPLKYQVEVEDK